MDIISQTINYIEVVANKEAQGLDSTPEEWNKAASAIRAASSTLSSSQFLLIAEAFNNVYLYFDLDTIYIDCIESMPEYPPIELFTSTSSSYVIKGLRESCFLGGDFTPTSDLPIFSEVFNRIVASDIPLYKLLDGSLLEKCSLHELRLFIEVIFTIIHKEDPVNAVWYGLVETISLYLDQAVQR